MSLTLPVPMDARSRHDPGRESAPLLQVFVYGTLRRGGANHRFLCAAHFVREACTTPEYELVDLGGFPALVRGGEQRVCGEVWAVDAGTLGLLDELEDHPDYFRRSNLLLENGEQVEAYLLSPAQAAGFPRIPSGDWHRPR